MQELDCMLFKFRSGTHGLHKELGRHRGREGKKECVLCGDECESVSGNVQHSSIRDEITQASLGSYAHFEAMSSFDKAPFILGNELWDEHFQSLLVLV